MSFYSCRNPLAPWQWPHMVATPNTFPHEITIKGHPVLILQLETISTPINCLIYISFNHLK
jgi:hypothetical protein